MVFFIPICRALRKLFKVDPADYMISLCGNDALRELSSPGKSGSFFYLTNDDRYMIKTMKKSEVKVSSLLNKVHMFLNWFKKKIEVTWLSLQHVAFSCCSITLY